MSLKRLTGRAYAKINLGLEVLHRREDGYHELRTVLSTIDLHDELHFELAERDIRVTTDAPELETGETNLVHQAASLVRETFGVGRGVAVHIKKRIPPGKGLGGGSADAAITLLALDRLWRLGAPAPELHRLASRIGMDAPFFLYGGQALAVGRGDEVYPLAVDADCRIVLILPDFSISTANVYRNLMLTKPRSGLKLLHFAWTNPCVRHGLGELVNDLEGATGEHSTSIRDYKQLLLERGASASMMSGSGSAVFGIFPDETSARRAASSLEQKGLRALATTTLAGKAYREKRLEEEA